MRSSAVIGLAALALLAVNTPAASQDWRTIATSRQKSGEQFLDIKIEYAVGRFAITKASGRFLYRLESKYDSDSFDLRSDYRESGDGGRLEVELDGEKHLDLGDIKNYEVDGSLQLAVTDAIPIALDLSMAAVEADLDLGGLRLTRLSLQTGASETSIRFDEPNSEAAESCSFKVGAAEFEAEGLGNSGCRNITFKGGVGSTALDFSGEWRNDATATIEVGLGTVELLVPEAVGVRVETNTFFMSFDAPDLIEQGDVWLSENWDQAEHNLTIRVKGALGSIELTRI